MKRILCATIIIIIMLTGCTTQNPPENPNEPPKIADYFPMTANTHYVYEGEGNEYASFDVYIDYTADGKVQRRIDNGGTVTAQVIELSEGKLKGLIMRGEVYYRENLLNEADEETEIMLMEPLAIGTTWELADGGKRTITSMDAEIETPSGSYKAMEVETLWEGDKMMEYYAKGVGMVKSVFVSDKENLEVSSTLSMVEKDVPLNQIVHFFFPNTEDNTLYYQDKTVELYTNDDPAPVLTLAYKNVDGDKTQRVFSENTVINAMKLRDDGVLSLDLNRAFLTEMNAGSGYEAMILQSIANTFGSYYGVEKIALTIDGSLYESGHIAMKEGEYLTTDFENVKRWE